MAFGSLRLIVAAAVLLLAPAVASAQTRRPQTPAARPAAARRTVSLILNSGPSGANAWLLLAESSGYFRTEGLDLRITNGRGAYTAANRMVHEGFDFGYGDINALVEEASIRPDSTPMGVFMLFNRSPSAIILKHNSPITTPKQLEGKRIIGHATDVALSTFEAFAERMKVDPEKVTIIPDSSGFATLISKMEAGEADAVFGYITTSIAAVEGSLRNPDSTIRFLAYRDIVPELYGSTLMASRRLVNNDPAIVRAFVRAANRGLLAAMNDPDAAISEAMKRDPTLRPDVERNRLIRTLRGDMGHPEGALLGIGDIDPKRFALSIRMMKASGRMPRLPEWDTVFSRDFLPPLSERVKTLAEQPKKP